jgi:hypothetical protein
LYEPTDVARRRLLLISMMATTTMIRAPTTENTMIRMRLCVESVALLEEEAVDDASNDAYKRTKVNQTRVSNRKNRAACDLEPERQSNT